MFENKTYLCFEGSTGDVEQEFFVCCVFEQVKVAATRWGAFAHIGGQFGHAKVKARTIFDRCQVASGMPHHRGLAF